MVEMACASQTLFLFWLLSIITANLKSLRKTHLSLKHAQGHPKPDVVKYMCNLKTRTSPQKYDSYGFPKNS